MNDVLRIDTSTGASGSGISNEDQLKNNAFGVFTLILNVIALLFIIYTVAPEYRFVKRLIAAIKNVRRLHAFLCPFFPFVTTSVPQSRALSQTGLGFTRRKSVASFLSQDVAEMAEVC